MPYLRDRALTIVRRPNGIDRPGFWQKQLPGHTFEATRDWVLGVSRAVGAAVPELVSWEWEKTRRRGLARLAYTQNAFNKTLVAPYAARPAAGAPVSATISWAELEASGGPRRPVRALADHRAGAACSVAVSDGVGWYAQANGQRATRGHHIGHLGR